MKQSPLVFLFKVRLLDIAPPVWRRIQVPASYSFWDLHVALQDAVGWLDCHLHAFRFPLSKWEIVEIGIPDDDFDEMKVLAGWEVPITEYFKSPGDVGMYEYDFGDSWEHELVLEGILLKEKGVKYPRCLEGKRACPPEDCGGVPGYYSLLEILSNPANEDHDVMVDWLQNHIKNYFPYDPEQFDAGKVKFSNPKTRWKKMFA